MSIFSTRYCFTRYSLRLSFFSLLLTALPPLLSGCGEQVQERGQAQGQLQPQGQVAAQPGRDEAPQPQVSLIPQFEERAAGAGLRFQHDNGGSGRLYYPEVVGPGCALFDYDNDGWLDIYLVQGGPLPGWRGKEPLSNKLYRNNGNGTFSDVTRQAGVSGVVQGKKSYGMGCAVGDFDGDGRKDLLVTNLGACILYRNNGNGTFSDVTPKSGIKGQGFWTSAAFTDYDNDGRLDLFICRYIKYQLGDDLECGATARQRDYCPPGFFPPSQSALYRNNGNGTFTDVTRRAGVLSAYNKALGVVAADFNGDGWQDIYVTCDLTPNLLYMNRGDGTFRDEAVEQGTAFSSMGRPQASMGVDARDYDGDLKPDIVVTNYWLEGANLYRNMGQQMFNDANQETGLGSATLRRVGWGTALRDFNNDTLLDCFMANGHVLLHPEQSTPGATIGQADQLFVNVGGNKFRDVSAQAGPWFRQKRVARGAAFGDVDNDGDMDVLVAHNNDKPALLINNGDKGGQRNNWLAVKLTGRKSNRDGLGAKVRITVNGKTFHEEIHSAYSFASASDLRAHFGLGNAASVETLKIEWPSRQTDTFRNVKANQTFAVTEGQSAARN